jgi:N6-L-threonylcarbamoyladenine synthase
MSQNSKYKILAIDTSCDETSAAVTGGTKILSNIIWSQASLHAKFGGVLPSLAQREHEKRIDFVVDKAIKNAQCQMTDIDAVAVTLGPGLAIALGVGINKAKELATKYHKPLIGVNHLEGHVLAP